MIALGRRRRRVARPAAVGRAGGDPEDIVTIAMWAVPAGPRRRPALPRRHRLAELSGALGRRGQDLGRRPRHPRRHRARRRRRLLYVARRRGIRIPVVLDAATPALPLAQAIGRWGNWFNQELFGGPPTCRGVSRSTRPTAHAEYADVETFHPTFLYESLWNLALVRVPDLARPHRPPAPGYLFARLRRGLLRRPARPRDAAGRSGQPACSAFGSTSGSASSASGAPTRRPALRSRGRSQRDLPSLSSADSDRGDRAVLGEAVQVARAVRSSPPAGGRRGGATGSSTGSDGGCSSRSRTS
jgi:hypothetical protein